MSRARISHFRGMCRYVRVAVHEPPLGIRFGRILITKFSTESRPTPVLTRWMTAAKQTVFHYWNGTVQLYSNIREMRRLNNRLIHWQPLNRREFRLIHKTENDLVTLVPFFIYLAIPFSAYTLPIVLKLFPTLLPSTYLDDLQRKQAVDKLLEQRLSLRNHIMTFLRARTEALIKQPSMVERGLPDLLLGIIDKATRNVPVNNSELFAVAPLFATQLQLETLSREETATLNRYYGHWTFGLPKQWLQDRLRGLLAYLSFDDQLLLREGLDQPTPAELSEACHERGLRATALSTEQLVQQLASYLELSGRVPALLQLVAPAFNIGCFSTPPPRDPFLNEKVVMWLKKRLPKPREPSPRKPWPASLVSLVQAGGTTNRRD